MKPTSMHVTLYRRPGFMARQMALDVLIDGERAARLDERQTLEMVLPDQPVSLQLQLPKTDIRSKAITLKPGRNSLQLECGTPLWVLFDVLSIGYLQPFRQHVLFVQPCAPEA